MVTHMSKIDIDKVRPQDCTTLADKINYSLAVRERYEQLVEAPYSKPSDLSDFYDRYPTIEECPWTHPDWATEYAKSAREQQRAKRKFLRGLG
jgi:hypothetical protein